MSKHEKQSKTLVERIKKARTNLKAACGKLFKSPGVESADALMKATRKLEIAMFGFGVHYSVYACDCYKQVMPKKPETRPAKL